MVIVILCENSDVFFQFLFFLPTIMATILAPNLQLILYE